MALSEKLAHALRSGLRRLAKTQTVGVKSAIFNPKGDILLVRHTYCPGWTFPGGGIAPGELPLTAVRREVFEETGLVLEQEIELFGVYHSVQRGLDDYAILFIARNITGTPRKNDPLEIRDAGWFNPENLPENTTTGTRNRLQEILNGAPRKEKW